ncbi:MAG: alpha/beta hydrolase [Planctomycetota bacterium]|nr:alpha/beta hydrolase [Planctomycetota bacterium]
MARILILMLMLLTVTPHTTFAQNNNPSKEADHKHLAYGKHKRQFLHLWLPDTNRAAPLLVHFHGGGFISGNIRQKTSSQIAARLNATGIAYADVEYRLLPQTLLTDILRDCARAIQFLRHRASQYRLDTARVAAFGESAGAGASLWLATRDDLANSQSRDPVLRQSSRVIAAGGSGVQATYDVAQWPQILGLKPENTPYWGMMQRFKRQLPPATFLQLRRDSDMLAHVDKQDPPLHFSPGNQGRGVHSHLFVKALRKRAAVTGADLTIEKGNAALIRFLVGHLRESPKRSPVSPSARSP